MLVLMDYNIFIKIKGSVTTIRSEITTYIGLVSISGVLSILLGIYAYVNRKNFASSNLFILISIFSSFYIFGHALELASSSLYEINQWIKVQYIGLPFIAPCTLILIIQFIGLDIYLTRINLTILFTIPILTLLMVVTNDSHHLFYESVYLRPGELSLLADVIMGPWYIVHGSYTFGCLLLGSCLIVGYWKRIKTTYWKQLLTMLIGLVIPMTASIIYLTGCIPGGMDPVPIVMCFTSLLYLWAFISTKMFIVVPIAREKVFENMRDAVLVIDTSNVIVDFNKAATTMMRTSTIPLIGSNIETVWQMVFKNNSPAHWSDFETHLEEHKVQYNDSEEVAYYQIYASPLLKRGGHQAGRMVILSNVTEERLLRETLEQLAFKDGLTNIYNRSYFLEQCTPLLNQAHLYGHSFSLLLFDIDHFKQINDTYGHSIGDDALCHVVSLCKQHLQKQVIFARYGGEEFIVGIPSTSLHEAERIAEELRLIIENGILLTNTHPVSITASFGVAEAQDSKITLKELIQQADQALYAAKRKGRNIVQIAQQLETRPMDIS